jgi:glycosyltransferase involved in cell wall biosynthesis
MNESLKKRIWLVTELFYPEEDATAYIFTKIATYLTREFDVKVICGPISYDGADKKVTNDDELNKSINIYRKNIIKLDKNNLVKRTFRFFLLSFQLFNTLRRNISKGDTVLLATNPAPLILLVGLMKSFKVFQLHILVHDVFPENTIAIGIFKKKSNFIYRLIKFVFDFAYCHADHIIVLGKDMKEIFEDKIRRKKKTITVSVIPNWGDIRNVAPVRRSESLIKKWGLEDKIVLQFAGNIGRVQGLEEVIETFFLSNNPELHLVIFGSGAFLPAICQFIKENNIRNISVYDVYSRSEQSKILNSCDIAIVSLSKGMYGLGVPSKAYNILAAGKPILFIGEPGSEISQMVIDEEIGWSLDISHKNELVDFLSQLSLKTLDDLSALGSKARKLCEKKYSESIVLDELLNSIKSISS